MSILRITNRRSKRHQERSIITPIKVSLLFSMCLSTFSFSSISLANSLPTKNDSNELIKNISFEQMKKDISFLADDNLQGRANFSKEISQAGDYIAERFSGIGLTSPQNIQHFKQVFYVNNIIPKEVAVTINGENIAPDHLAMATTKAEFSWQSVSETNVHVIGQNDDMRSLIGKMNKTGGDHLVLLDASHENMFHRYQAYFQQGLTKLDTKNSDTKGGTIVLALNDKALSKTDIQKITVKGTATLTKQALTNIVGILPGKTHPEEIVLYSAHYDHLGINPNNKDDKIFNGADDDASGTTAIMNLAEHFAKQNNNARTLMFAAFTAEEIGGFGSRYFSEQLDADHITAMINIEMIGKPSKIGAGMVWMTGMDRSNLGELLNHALATSPLEIYKDPYPKQGLFYRSDNATLARLGVPAHSFSSTQLDKDKHYHQVSDDLANLDLPSMYNVINAMAIATQGLVDGSITPSRIDPNLVKNKGLIY